MAPAIQVVLSFFNDFGVSGGYTFLDGSDLSGGSEILLQISVFLVVLGFQMVSNF